MFILYNKEEAIRRYVGKILFTPHTASPLKKVLALKGNKMYHPKCAPSACGLV